MSDSPIAPSDAPSLPARRSFPLLRPLWVWSVAFEPLMFFVLVSDRGVAGVTISLSRLLQVLVLAGLAVHVIPGLLTQGTIRRPWRRGDGWRLYWSFWVYFALAVFAGIIGIVSGAYSLTQAYESASWESGFARLLNSEWMRPLVEYLIVLYYFIYFMVLAPVFLKTRAHLRYMFYVFTTVFLISFVLGVIDLAQVRITNQSLLPRHLSDWRDIGDRFHGLAGEPRTAFVYLFFGWAVFQLRAEFRGRRLSRWFGPLVIAAAVLAESTSGLLGIACFVMLYAIYSLFTLSPRRLAELTLALILVAAIAAVTISYSPRTRLYGSVASEAWSALEAGRPLPSPLDLQRDNIFPLYDMVTKLRRLDLLPILIGSGLGSASAVNNRLYDAEQGLTNPNAQIVRTLYESGLVGTCFFVMIFVQPVRYLTRHLRVRERHRFMVMLLLLIGCAFGTRSSAPFAYAGLLIATFRASAPAAGTVPARPVLRPEARTA